MSHTNSRKQIDTEFVSLFWNYLVIYQYEFWNIWTILKYQIIKHTWKAHIFHLISLSTHFRNELYGLFYLESRTFKILLWTAMVFIFWKSMYTLQIVLILIDFPIFTNKKYTYLIRDFNQHELKLFLIMFYKWNFTQRGSDICKPIKSY